MTGVLVLNLKPDLGRFQAGQASKGLAESKATPSWERQFPPRLQKVPTNHYLFGDEASAKSINESRDLYHHQKTSFHPENGPAASTRPCIQPLCSGVLFLFDMYRKWKTLFLWITKKAKENCHWTSPRAHNFLSRGSNRIARISLLAIRLDHQLWA